MLSRFRTRSVSPGERRPMPKSRAGGVLDRRRFVLNTAGMVTGVASLAQPSATIATPVQLPTHSLGKKISPPPSPIPGGLEVSPGFVIHIFGTGDPSVTLPFTGITLQGFDVEPSTITDFNGSTALAYHVGRARGSDGRTYDLETDIRAFEGEYVADGEVRHGSFALI
jgi:hypothetical protein